MATDRLLPRLLNWRRTLPPATFEFVDLHNSPDADMLPHALFIKLLCLERKRAERSGRGFVLMLLDAKGLLCHRDHLGLAEKVHYALSESTRETDIKGWYKQRDVIGVIFTETPLGDPAITQLLAQKVNRALRKALNEEQIKQISLSFHVFPDRYDDEDSDAGTLAPVYPDVVAEIESKQIPLLVKRTLDIVGSSLGILLLAPLLLLIALAVRFSSRGPALFRQRRVGQYGKSFTFLKFRSMYTSADHAIHETYVKLFISNRSDGSSAGEQGEIYKLKADPRITRVGRFLRRTSLDELPQLFNVLAGHMSLVGPRPPVLYEFASYDVWHKRRLLVVKPGITGFWQVHGRSRVKFDEMVRMDLEYARTWSLSLDISILLRTPRAVLSGEGAY
jgi:lipopolysaccharide/colanic/teichoic acid biosynthesis glycosyltransferase